VKNPEGETLDEAAKFVLALGSKPIMESMVNKWIVDDG